jgi:hypothetical protein
MLQVLLASTMKANWPGKVNENVNCDLPPSRQLRMVWHMGGAMLGGASMTDLMFGLTFPAMSLVAQCACTERLQSVWKSNFTVHTQVHMIGVKHCGSLRQTIV